MVTFGPLGHFLPYLKGPLNSPKTIFFFKHNIFPTFLCHIEPAYQKLCFYDENGDFWPCRAPFALFKRAPKLIKNGFFQKYFFLFFSYVTLSILAKNYVSITKTAAFGPLGSLRAPFAPLKRAPKLIRIQTFQT